jgi:hypothetical protein
MDILKQTLINKGWVDVAQRSDDWYAGRLKFVGGSEILKCLLDFPQFIADKYSENPELKEFQSLFDHGTFTEKIINKHYEDLRGRKVHEFGSIKGYYNNQSYSPDGICYDEETGRYILCEYKSPTMRELYLSKDKFKKDYLMQVMLGVFTLELYDIKPDVEFFESYCIYSPISDINSQKGMVLQEGKNSVKYYHNESGDRAFYLLEITKYNDEFKTLFELDDYEDSPIDIIEANSKNVSKLINYMLKNNSLEYKIHEMNDISVLRENRKSVLMLLKLTKNNCITFDNSEFTKFKEPFLKTMKQYCEIFEKVSKILIEGKAKNSVNKPAKYDHAKLLKYFENNTIIKCNSNVVTNAKSFDKLGYLEFLEKICNLTIEVNYDDLETNIKNFLD